MPTTQEVARKAPLTEPPRLPVVVIVDDQPEVLVSLRRALRDERFELATFSSPVEALEWTRTHPADLVIADERMPEMRGSDFLEQMRDRSPATVRVILTAYPGSATVGYGLAHGVDWLISKPWNDDALRITLRQLLEEHGIDTKPPPADPPVLRTEQSLEQELRERTRELELINNELLTEIAERNRAEETKRLTEMRFRLLVEGVTDYAIVMLAPDGIVVSWNVGAERIAGYEAEEILGRNFSLFYLPEDVSAGKPERLLQTAAKQDRVEDEGWRVRRDGSRFWCHVVITAVRDSGGRLIGFSKVTRDMSEPRRAEEERNRLQASMLQGQKLQAIGQLSAGIAHEINNPVGYILSNLNTMGEYCADLRRLCAAAAEASRAWQDKRDPSAALAEYTRLAQEIHADHVLSDLTDIVSDCKLGGEKIRDIVRSLREFSHVDPSELHSADLNKVLDDSLRICWNELKYKASLKKDYASLPPVPCFAQRLGQVFVNLLVNAAQAIDKKGEISIRTSVEDGFAVVRIRDTGKGIAPEHLGKIFEPFFTTKEIGAGTGLGLHVAYKIITAHRGRIEVASEAGKGTEFTVRLPLDGPPVRKG